MSRRSRQREASAATDGPTISGVLLRRTESGDWQAVEVAIPESEVERYTVDEHTPNALDFARRRAETVLWEQTRRR